MRRLLAVTAGVMLLAGCSDPPESEYVVSQLHHYPVHSRVTYAGTCPLGLSDTQPLPADCTRTQVNYKELYEVCAVKSGTETCWYATQDWVYQEQQIGRPLQDKEYYLLVDAHPHPTNEWGQPS